MAKFHSFFVSKKLVDAPNVGDLGLNSWVGRKTPWRMEWLPTSVILHRIVDREPVEAQSRGAKSQMAPMLSLH